MIVTGNGSSGVGRWPSVLCVCFATLWLLLLWHLSRFLASPRAISSQVRFRAWVFWVGPLFLSLGTKQGARGGGGVSLSKELPRAQVNIQTNTALFLFSPMEGGRFDLFMAFFPPPFFLLNQKGRVWFQEFRNSWLEELLVSDLLEFFFSWPSSRLLSSLQPYCYLNK